MIKSDEGDSLVLSGAMARNGSRVSAATACA